jgi:hypothetical protein
LVQTGQDADRQWFRPVIDGFFGMVAFLRGDFPTARSWFERAAAGISEDETPHLEALWFIPHDSVAISHEHLAIDDVLHGDVEGAEVELLKARQRSEQLAFPTGPYNYVYAIDMEIWMRVEAGQFDLAGELVTDMLERAERHGFDFWQMFGMTEQSLVSAYRLLNSGNLDSAALSAEIEAMTQWVELWRALGLVAYQTHYDCIVAELLITANRLDEARARIDTGLRIAEDTGMRMYNTELLRMRARTQSHADARAADLAASIELARHQDAPLFELRSVLDDFEFRGEVARQALVDALQRLPSDSVVPEVSRARALLDGRT